MAPQPNDDLDAFVAEFKAAKQKEEADHQAMLARVRAEAQAEIAAKRAEDERRVKEMQEREAAAREAALRGDLKARWLAAGGTEVDFEINYRTLRDRYLTAKVEEDRRADEARRTAALQQALREF